MKFIKYVTISTLIVILNLACKPDQGNELFDQHPQLQTLEQEYKAAPDVSKANELLRSLSTVLTSPDFDKSKTVPFLEYGYQIASDQNMNSRKASFLFPLIKEDYKNAETPDRIFELMGIMEKMNKDAVVVVLAEGLKQSFPDYERLGEIKATLPDTTNNVDEFVANLGKRIFDKPDNTGINRVNSLNYVDACEAFALVNPNNALAPDYLFKAAEVAKSLRTFPKSLSLYDWIISDYPDYEKMPTALFLKGFIIENNLGDDELAGKVYNEFVTRFPDHELADDVEFLIENLGKTDEEILEMIEKRRDAQEGKTDKKILETTEEGFDTRKGKKQVKN